MWLIDYVVICLLNTIQPRLLLFLFFFFCCCCFVFLVVRNGKQMQERKKKESLNLSRLFFCVFSLISSSKGIIIRKKEAIFKPWYQEDYPSQF